jgi:hypothetical protein
MLINPYPPRGGLFGPLYADVFHLRAYDRSIPLVAPSVYINTHD